MVLLYLGRNLPAISPAALYFNHTVRLLFWRPAPSFYTDALSSVLPTTHRSNPSPTETPSAYEVKSNSYEIGLDDTDEDDWEMVTKSKPMLESNVDVVKGNNKARRIEGSRDMIPEQDLRNGGYPTFSGNGIGAMNSQVPRGFMEKDKSGMPTALKRETDNITIRHQQKSEKTQPGPGRQSEIKRSAAERMPTTGSNKDQLHRRPKSAFEAIQADLDRAETLYRETLPPTFVPQPKISRNLSNKSTKSDISAYGGLGTEKPPGLPSTSEVKVDSRSSAPSDANTTPKTVSSRPQPPTQGKKERNRSTPTVRQMKRKGDNREVGDSRK